MYNNTKLYIADCGGLFFPTKVINQKQLTNQYALKLAYELLAIFNVTYSFELIHALSYTAKDTINAFFVHTHVKDVQLLHYAHTLVFHCVPFPWVKVSKVFFCS